LEYKTLSGDIYEVIIIGGGPAGLTAGLYAARAGLNTMLIEKGIFGGQITYAEHVENFAGFPEGISGMELGDKMHVQAEKHGLKTIMAEVTAFEITGALKIVKTTDGEFTGKAVILAGGAVRRKLGIDGETRLTGRGVSYCAVCDAAFFRDQKLAVVGGGDTAITEALHLAKVASKVTIIHRRDQLRAAHILQEKVRSEPKIDFIWDTTIFAIEGEDNVERIRLLNNKTNQNSILEVSGVFISVGTNPDTEYLRGILPLDESGYISTNEKMETSIPGILAAGDIRHNSARQAITAAGDGATAAIYAQKYLIESTV
jgi:thioredoxin reductase (NADPH)